MKTDVKEIELQVWQEIIGHCVRFEAKKGQIAVILRVCGQNVRIAYPRNSEEAIVLRRFGRRHVGQKIGILRTDIPSKPIVVRVMPKKDATR